MRPYAIALAVIYLLAKTHVRFWFFKPIQDRPAVTRQNQTLRFVDLVAWLALIGAFFLLLNTGSVKLSFAMIMAAILYDVAIRYLFLQWEIFWVRRRAPKLSRREAGSRVRRREQATMFH